jgi:tetratricopeptide (TPR) repeat protein
MRSNQKTGPGAAAFALLALLAGLPAFAEANDRPAGVPPPAAPPPEKATPDAKGPGAKGPESKAAPNADSADERAKLLDELYARLAVASDENAAAPIAEAIEQLWLHSGSATADLLLARASAAIDAQNKSLAMKLLDAAVELQPDYAEAWNRRAYLYYLEDDVTRALGDIRRVLALEPRHYKALEGLANLLRQVGEKKAALEAYEALLKVNPNVAGARTARDELKTEVDGQGI